MPRPPVLDEYKRREVLALASVGLSRRAIAEYVGCAANTIENTARRDPDFARRLGAARGKFVFDQMKSIQQQARTSWRASTWLLERADPDNFGHRPPDCITPRQQTRQFRDWAHALGKQIMPSMRPVLERESAKLARELFGAPQSPEDGPHAADYEAVELYADDADDSDPDDSADNSAMPDTAAHGGQSNEPTAALAPHGQQEGCLPPRPVHADAPTRTSALDEEDFIPPDVGHFDFSDPNWVVELLADRGTVTVPSAAPAPATDRPSQSAPPAAAPPAAAPTAAAPTAAAPTAAAPTAAAPTASVPPALVQQALVPPVIVLLLGLLLSGMQFVSQPGRTGVRAVAAPHAPAAPGLGIVIERRPPIFTVSDAKTPRVRQELASPPTTVRHQTNKASAVADALSFKPAAVPPWPAVVGSR